MCDLSQDPTIAYWDWGFFCGPIPGSEMMAIARSSTISIHSKSVLLFAMTQIMHWCHYDTEHTRVVVRLARHQLIVTDHQSVHIIYIKKSEWTQDFL